ncbi:MAG: folylpolyglutamate synthase/dihydrofolate synthase family protein [Actinomycetes bacterium]
MNFNESLAYLDSHINLEAKAGLIHGLSLDHMRSLVGVIGDPQDSFRVIHVTGTNGKGSTARMITALLVEHGLSVGTYSSPHLQRINERICWNGTPITDEQFATVMTDIARVAPLSGSTPSFFELLTAAALVWFAESAVDVAVIEVGLLGRYDATNVCHADVAVITNIGRDHTDGEGEWEQAIATEKAGIITETCTLVTGVTDPELRAIFETEGPERTYAVGPDFEVVSDLYAVGGHLIDVRTPFGVYEDLLVPMHGAHQSDNAAVAVVAVEAFFDRALDDTVVSEAFRSVTMPGRFEVVSHSPLVILDGAHNPDGAKVAAQTLRDEFDVAGRRVLVVGMLGGRDVVEMLESLNVRDADLVIACTPTSPRAVPASDIAAVVRAMGVFVEQIDDVATAVQRAIDLSTDDDVILVTGSLYVAGAARTAVEEISRRTD